MSSDQKNLAVVEQEAMNVVFVLWESSRRFQRDQTASKNMLLSALICSPLGFRVTLLSLEEVYSVGLLLEVRANLQLL